jgi:hypothetical protein
MITDNCNALCPCGNIIDEWEYTFEDRCHSTEIWWCKECGCIAMGFDNEPPLTGEFVLTGNERRKQLEKMSDSKELKKMFEDLLDGKLPVNKEYEDVEKSI